MGGLHRCYVIALVFIIRQAFPKCGRVSASQSLTAEKEPILKTIRISCMQPFQKTTPVQVELACLKGSDIQPILRSTKEICLPG